TNSFTVDTQAPVIDHFRLLNPHYGKNWYDRIRESTISLEIQYDEKYPQSASIDAGSLKDPDPNYDPPAGDNQIITFDVDIYTAIDGNYVLTAYLIDRAGNVSADTLLAQIDTTPPRDSRAQSPQISSTPTFTVSWAGGTDGSGVGLSGEYDVFVAIDGEWRIWKKRFSGKSDNYNGQFGHNYSFEAVAYDLLGHREDSIGVAESETAVIYSEIDTIPPIAPIDLMANGANPSRWQISNSFIITWQNPFDPSNLSRALYKLGAPPGSNFDTTATASTIPPLKITATEEFGQMLYLWLMDGSNNVDYRNHAAINLRYDATPPVVKIKCPLHQDRMKETIPVCASIFDVTIKEFQLDYQMDWHREWQFLYKNSLVHSCEDSMLFNWQNSNDSGSVHLKLTAYDKNGLSSSDSVVFILENENSPRPTAKILQPKNRAYVNGWISIQGYAADVNFLKYCIRLVGNGKDSLLVESIVQKRNEELHAFDSKKLSDGVYALQLIAWNHQQRCSGDVVQIIVDNSPPVARLISPSTDTISCCVEIDGVALDANLNQKIVRYAQMGEADPTKYIFIGHDFGKWDTRELNGYYQLYLKVTDHGGLSAEDSRLFYIDNQRYDPQQRFTKRCENAFLTIYPNSYPAAIICLQKVEKEDIQIDPNQLAVTDIIYEIYSSRNRMHFEKRALLSFDYSNLSTGIVDEEKLIIYRKKNNGWKLAGGTPDVQTKEIYTSIDSMGIYALCENGASQQPDGDDLDLSCQPRVFSPKNPGAENSVTISFYLKTAQEVTIRIYNPSGRIVKNLIENKYSSPGNNVIMWDGTDSSGRHCRSGLYIIVTRTKSKVKNQTIMVLNN
ncbi:T9SS type A sorting domain-containing protein, partial [candidate division KSB1 bacterium]|nr:T9SS type A sorting domain-containing protein [candidate division KSB1 bacterium]